MDSSVLVGNTVYKMEKYLSVHPEDVNIVLGGKTPLIHETQNGRTEIVDMLITSGANINFQDALGQSALHHYCQFQMNNLKLLQKLLEAGADPLLVTSHGNIPLHYAAERTNKVEVIQMLTVKSNSIQQNFSGNNPLMTACIWNNNANVISSLINITNDLNVSNNHGNTALHLACIFRNYNAIFLLLAAGVDREITNNNNKTAYDVADPFGKLLLDS